MYTPDSLYDAVVAELLRRKDPVSVRSMFDPVTSKPIAIRDGLFIISVRSELIRDRMRELFYKEILDVTRELTGKPLEAVFVCGQEAIEWRLREENNPFAGRTFESFIVGNSNKFAQAAAYAVASNPAVLYNPLFIYGPAGLGKTHLLFAIANFIRHVNIDSKCIYITGEEFTNDLIESLQAGNIIAFREKYRRTDLLLVDDIQFIAGKESTQEEFFHTFEAVYKAGHQIVVTSDRPPKEIATLSQRLSSRFEMGLLADISAPDFETRIALARAKAEAIGLTLPADVVTYIASAVKDNVRELEGAVRKLAALHKLMHEPVDIYLAEQAVHDIYKDKPGLHPTPELILEEVSSYYGEPIARIKGNSRLREVVRPRQAAIYLIREMTDLSLPQIGDFIGQHHSTVMYGYNRVKESLDSDPSLKADIDDLTKNIRSR